MDQGHIAVIGVGSYYPGAKNLQELWGNILSRRRQFRRFPDERLPLESYYDQSPSAPDKTYGRHAAVIDGFQFDWAGKRIPKSTYESADIVHWLALEVADQALKDAGYERGSIPKKKTGVILGNSLTGEFMRSYAVKLRWPFIRKTLRAAGQAQGLSGHWMARLEEQMEQIFHSVFPAVTEDTLSGNLSNTIAGRICNFYDLHGGGYVVDGACSSSLLALATAADRLVQGDLDIALAGGVDISLDPLEIVGFAKAGALTDKDMNVFDRFSSGFIPGEGSGMVVLKRLEDARRDGDYVYGVIRGWGISTDGKGGITAPKTEGQALALQRAYERANYSPHTLDFIEGHGTGTVLGDRIELEAISAVREAYGKPAPRSCGVTSFKSLVGHTKAAAGIGGFIKALLSVNQRILVPTAACYEPNEVFDTTATSIYPIQQGELLERTAHLRAGVSAMGFGGINCHVTLESADAPKESIKPSIDEKALLVSNQETEIYVFAAQTQVDLQEQLHAAIQQADGISMAEMADLAYELIKQPLQGDWRAVIIADHPDQLLERLQIAKDKVTDRISSGETWVDPQQMIWLSYQVKQHRVGMLFPGQGSQMLNMARKWVQRYPWAQDLAESLWHLLPEGENILYRAMEKAESQEEKEEWKQQLNQTDIAQPTICLASVIWLQFLKRLGIEPQVVGGHSLGELAALYAAEAYTEEELFQLAVLRGEAMKASGQDAGMMVSLFCDDQMAQKLLEKVSGYAVIANRNSSKQTVISGEASTVNQIAALAEEQELRTVKLPVSNAFHSELVSGAAEQLREADFLPTDSVPLQTPFISGMDGQVKHQLVESRDYFAQQVMKPVHFVSLMKTMNEHCDFVIEVGPGRVLSGLVASDYGDQLPSYPVESVAGQDSDWQKILAAYFVAGGKINWEVLYENRLIYPFTPVSEKTLVVNPCEKPLTVSAVEGASSNLEDVLSQTLTISDDTLRQYLAQRGSFICDVIESDLKHMSGQAIPSIQSKAFQDEPVPGKKVSIVEPLSSDSLQQSIINQVAEATGFPESSITLDLRLLDDLNLDSIKSAELISTLADQWSVVGQLDPTGYANATLEELMRAVQPFLPDDPKKPMLPAADRSSKVRSTLRRHVEELTGFPSESLTLDLRLLDDLNLDSIKSAELITSLLSTWDLSNQLDPGSFANASLQEIEESLLSLLPDEKPVITAPSEEVSVQEILLTEVENMSGFPRSSLTQDLRLLDDLNLDSIKSADLVRQVVNRFTLQESLDPSLFANASLQEIAERIENLRVTTSPSISEAPLLTKKVSQKRNWVRNFQVKYVEEVRTERSLSFPSTSRFLFVVTQKRNALAQHLMRKLGELGIEYHLATFSEVDTVLDLQKHAFSHMVVLLPKSDGNEKVDRTVKRLRSVISPVARYGYQASITYIQYGGGFFGTRSNRIQLGSSLANAFASSLHMERPQAKIRVIDLCPTLKEADMVEDILIEIAAKAPFVSVGFDKGRVRRVPQAIVDKPSQYQARSISWTAEDVMLVTGGAKGITAACALEVARSTGVKMALVGSSPKREHSEIADTLLRFQEEGLQAEYYSCDIADKKAVERLIEKIESDLGKITAVIHGAALMRPKRAEQISFQAFMNEISPKVNGALYLSQALRNHSLKMFVGLSSLAGITGMEGNTSYGFANEALQLILRRYEQIHPETQVLSVAFSVWDEIGMGARSGSIEFLEKKDTYAIPVAEGVKRFAHMFHFDPGDKQVVITAKMGGIDTWHPRPVQRRHNYRFIEEVVSDYPEVELINRVHLTLEKDPYIRQHQYKGAYLFPAVFGLEAMAQAVSYATGRERFQPVRITDIQFQAPILVDPVKGATIETYVEVLEDGRIKSEIRAEQTAYEKVHFSATFQFIEGRITKYVASDFPDQILPVDMKKDFYKLMMFHGPLYHRITALYEVKAEQEEAYCLVSAHNQVDSNYLLGDPYFHDSLLQSGRVILPQDEFLPISIDALEIHEPLTEGNWKVKTSLEQRNGSQRTFDVEVINEEGQIVQTLYGYQAHCLEYLPYLPTVAELISGVEAQERKLVEKAEEIAQSLSIILPKIGLERIPGIHQQSKDRRHEWVQSLFQQTLTKVEREKELTLTWEETGKPVLQTKEGVPSDLGISFSHDDEWTLCVIGKGEQGCDVLPIETHRTEADWLQLLTERHQPNLQQLLEQEEAAHLAGSRIWCCIEAAKKASGVAIERLELVQREDTAVEWKVSTQSGAYRVITFPIQLGKSEPRMIAISTKQSEERLTPPPEVTSPTTEQLYSSYHPQYGYVHRFPVLFENTSTISRRVNLSSFTKWMGKVRELFVPEVFDQVKTQMTSGDWGMVTNFIHTELVGEADANDIMEAHLQLAHMEDDSYAETICYWYKIKDNKELELVAKTRQAITWVEIIGHGLVRKAPFPDYFKKVLIEKLSPSQSGGSSHSLPSLSLDLLGEEQYVDQTVPAHRPILQRGTFETSLEESNLVGNIYFANYTVWQGKVRDQFLYRLAPELFQGTGQHGEWIPLDIQIHHLREAMPFDTIQVEMTLSKRYQHGVKLFFDYYKIEEDGQKQKLAYGKSHVLRVIRDEQGNPQPGPLPKTLDDLLAKQIGKS